jgi:PAS domain S-box-containing protein
MNDTPVRTRLFNLRGPIAVFAFLCVTIMALTYVFFSYRQAVLKKQKFEELSAIADLKRGEIVNWRAEQLAFGAYLMRNPFIAETVAQWVRGPQDPALRGRLTAWMRELQAYRHFSRIALVDSSFTRHLALQDTTCARSPDRHGAIADALASREPRFIDLHREAGGAIHLDLIVPFRSAAGAPLAACVLEIDPDAYLYPLIRNWPMPSRSAETLLFRALGDSIEYLNELRHIKGSALSFRLHAKTPRLLAAHALRIDSGIADGVDYRSKPALGAFRAIPGSPWYMVAKIDKEEVFSPVRRLVAIFLCFALVFIVCAGLLVVALDRRQRARHYRALYEEQKKRATLSARNEAILNTVPDIIAEVDMNKVYTWMNGAGHAFFGDGAIGRGAAFYFEGDQDTYAQVRPLFNGNTDVFYVESWQRRHDGEKRLLAWWCQALKDPHGKMIGAISTARDITEERKAAAAIAGSEKKFRSLFESMAEGVALHETVYDASGKPVNYRIIDANPSYEKHTGISPTAARGKLATELYGTSETPYLDEFCGVGETGVPNYFETYFPPMQKHFAISVCSAARGTFATVFEDITERKNHETALAVERERLLVTLRSIGDGVITTDVEGKITLMNKVAEELTGWRMADAVGRPLGDVFHIINEQTRQRCDNPVDKVLKSGGIVGLANHTALISKDGRERVIADSGAPIRDRESRVIGVVLVFRDITDKQKIDDALRNAQKLESIGTLAGGIAHDFNNLLGGVFGYVDMALDATKDKTVANYLSRAMGAMERARALTRQLLTFAKGGAPLRQPGPLFPFVAETAQFALSGSNVSCACDFPPDLWQCSFDRNQIGQVIDNIVINAQQAMPGGGTVAIGAENVMLALNNPAGLAPGNYVRIVIRDSGIGIPPEILPRIFDPFFTTKQKGSGLGLATAYSIVKKHDGHIEARSEGGKGSVFTLYLPAQTAAGARAREAAAPQAAHRGRGTVLLLDDEEVVRDSVAAMLEILGYTAACFSEGKDLVRHFRDAAKKGHAVTACILDLTIPGGMGGQETALELRKIDGRVPLFVASGYAEDPILAEPAKHGFLGSISKPFIKAELAALLEKNLRNR